VGGLAVRGRGERDQGGVRQQAGGAQEGGCLVIDSICMGQLVAEKGQAVGGLAVRGRGERDQGGVRQQAGGAQEGGCPGTDSGSLQSLYENAGIREGRRQWGFVV